MAAEEEKYINRCFELALMGKGIVSPNPLVGALIVKDGRIISEGYHAQYGMPHAEAAAFANCTEETAGAVLYCNLEPCCHTNKKTPPCVPLIIEKGISRVVISSIDPNPEVAGKGIELLRAKGVDVTAGILAEEGAYLNRFFFKYIKTGQPYITIKIAESADGKISAGEGIRTQITGEEAAKFVHTLRSEHDAVLIGATTLNVDNPQLNVRYGSGRDPKRIIIDGRLNCRTDADILNGDKAAGTIIITSSEIDINKIELLRSRGATVLLLNTANGKIPMQAIINVLGEARITSVLVEGGREIFNSFIDENLFDELIVIKSPKVLGGGIDSPELPDSSKLVKIGNEKLGFDEKTQYLKR